MVIVNPQSHYKKIQGNVWNKKRDRKGNGIIFKKWEIYHEEIKIRGKRFQPTKIDCIY